MSEQDPQGEPSGTPLTRFGSRYAGTPVVPQPQDGSRLQRVHDELAALRVTAPQQPATQPATPPQPPQPVAPQTQAAVPQTRFMQPQYPQFVAFPNAQQMMTPQEQTRVEAKREHNAAKMQLGAAYAGMGLLKVADLIFDVSGRRRARSAVARTARAENERQAEQDRYYRESSDYYARQNKNRPRTFWSP